MLRQRIISSATELFGAKGFEQVLTDEVALHAGVGKGSVYRQFGSKEQLYAATVIEGFKHLCDQVEAALGDVQSDRDRLTTIVRHALTYFWDRRQFFVLLRDPTKLPRAEETRYRTERGHLARLLSDVLREGGREGRIRADLDYELLAECLLGMMRGVQRSSVKPCGSRTQSRQSFRCFWTAANGTDARRLDACEPYMWTRGSTIEMIGK